jgi:hypothetical protein
VFRSLELPCFTNWTGVAGRKRARQQPHQDSLITFTTSSTQSKEFTNHLVKALVTGCVPLAFVENDFLRKAARVVGIDLPTRKVVSTTLLDELFDSTQTFSKKSIADIDYPCGASDGWQKKYCEQGNPLMNFTVLGNEGEQDLFKIH